MMRTVSVLMMVLALGCAAEHYPASQADRGPMPTEMEMEDAPASAAETVATSGVALGPDETALPKEARHQRKIIYTATVDLVVEDFGPVPQRVEELTKQFDGFVAYSNVSGAPRYPRTGTWRLRVPAESHGAFLAAIRQLGWEIQRVQVDSKDVTEEFYDVEARIRNKKKAEERLIDLLDNKTGELQHVLTVERELARVREEIERVEGRLRVLADLTSLSTFTLNVTEVKDYVPEESPSYLTRVRRTFRASIDSLVFAAQEFSIAMVALAPWLGVLLVFLFLLWIFWRLVVRPIIRRRCSRNYVKAEVAGESPFGS